MAPSPPPRNNCAAAAIGPPVSNATAGLIIGFDAICGATKPNAPATIVAVPIPTATFLTVGLLISGIFDAKPLLDDLRLAGARLLLATGLLETLRLIVFRTDLRFGAERLPLALAMAPNLLSFALCFAERRLLAIRS